jgi:glycosyltransferase involved in cell wall biosynthesis
VVAPRLFLATGHTGVKVGGIESLIRLLSGVLRDQLRIIECPGLAAPHIYSRRELLRTMNALRSDRLAEAVRRSLASEGFRPGMDSLAYCPAFPLGFIADKVGVAYSLIASGNDITYPLGSLAIRRRTIEALEAAEHIITTGLYPSELLSTRVPWLNHVQAARPWGDPARFTFLDQSVARATLGIPGGTRFLLTVSRLVRRKAVSLSIDALDYLPENTSLVVIGDGPDRDMLEHRAARFKGRVRFLGTIDETLLPLYYSACDAFVFTPLSLDGGKDIEGFGLTHLEAGFCGAPQIFAGTSGTAFMRELGGSAGMEVTVPSGQEIARCFSALQSSTFDRQAASVRFRQVFEPPTASQLLQMFWPWSAQPCADAG